jgi:GNAT superfamily N-acetyltransferase
VDVCFRRATPADAPVLAQLRWDFRSTRGGMTEDEASFLTRCVPWMTRALADPRWLCFVAEDPDIVGHLWIELVEKIPNPAVERERHAYITNVYVRPERRGAGIAARLIDEASAWCAREEVDTMFLWPSEKSRPLYRRHGFAASEAVLLKKIERGDL